MSVAHNRCNSDTVKNSHDTMAILKAQSRIAGLSVPKTADKWPVWEIWWKKSVKNTTWAVLEINKIRYWKREIYGISASVHIDPGPLGRVVNLLIMPVIKITMTGKPAWANDHGLSLKPATSINQDLSVYSEKKEVRQRWYTWTPASTRPLF